MTVIAASRATEGAKDSHLAGGRLESSFTACFTGSLWNHLVLARTLARGLQRTKFVANSTKRDASRF